MRCLLIAAICVLTTLQTFADDAEKARKIVDRGVKATGGAKAVKKMMISHFEDEGTYHGMGDGIPYNGIFDSHWPNKMRFEIADAFTNIQNGDKGWVKVQGMVIPMEKEQTEEAKKQRETGFVTTLIPLAKANKKYKLSLFGEETVDGDLCDGVNVNAEGMRQVTLFFSRKTGLLRKSSYVLKADELGGKEVVETAVYSEFKEVQGVQVPHKTLLHRDGKKFVESNLTKVEFPEEANDDLFKEPK